MRVKTDKRRATILAAASEVFREVGYARASMAMISSRIGGSKGTLYGYFKSKEELFAAVMMATIEEQASQVVSLLQDSDESIFTVLCRFGEAYLTLLTSAEGLSIMRTVIAESGHSPLGSILYTEGPEAAWNEISDYLGRLAERHMLRISNARIAAMHLKGLLEGGIVEPLLFGAKPWFDRSEGVKNAVEAFLRLYGTVPPEMERCLDAGKAADAG